MKYSELAIGDQFKSERFPNLIFKKTAVKGKSCCTPAHNAVGVGHNTKPFFKEDDEVEKIEVE